MAQISNSTPPLAEIVRRLDALEKRTVMMSDLPLAGIRKYLEKDWEPDANNLLLPKSAGNSVLATDSVDARVLAANAVSNTELDAQLQQEQESPGVLATKSAAQTLGNGTDTLISFDGTAFDKFGGIAHFEDANDGIRARIAGRYLIVAALVYVANNTGARAARLRKGGTSFQEAWVGAASGPASDRPTVVVVTAIEELAVNDLITVTGFQQSGGNLDVTTTFGGSSLGFSWIGRV